ncbi:MAG: hypothetical protein KIT82_00310 [Bradyrhizobium sp.]|nr:hypothetical protein [Bradyrhizobium sp.]
MAGFLIDETVVPGLATLDDIEIRDAATQFPFSPFPAAASPARKLFLYAFHAMPQTQVEAALSRHFSLAYAAIEQHSFDTLFSIINNHFGNSIFMTGRPRYFRYRELLKDRGFRTAALLRDPFDELAERLLFVRYASSDKSPDFTAKYLTGLESLVSLTRNFDFSEPGTIGTAFGKLTESQRDVLFNPLLRVLACNLDEIPTAKHIPIGLDYLAGMDAVGLFSHFDEFRPLLAEIMGMDGLGGAQLKEISFVSRIASELRKLEPVRRLLALDAELYARAKDAILQGLSRQ